MCSQARPKFQRSCRIGEQGLYPKIAFGAQTVDFSDTCRTECVEPMRFPDIGGAPPLAGMLPWPPSTPAQKPIVRRTIFQSHAAPKSRAVRLAIYSMLHRDLVLVVLPKRLMAVFQTTPNDSS